MRPVRGQNFRCDRSEGMGRDPPAGQSTMFRLHNRPGILHGCRKNMQIVKKTNKNMHVQVQCWRKDRSLN